jgi:ferritin-like metal-binding protein YciE
MQADLRTALPARLHSLAALAGLLERLDQRPRTASASQYQGVARQLSELLAKAEPDAHLDALLAAAPAAAELYENLRYTHAGLCRAPLERALNSEMAATAAIERARRGR